MKVNKIKTCKAWQILQCNNPFAVHISAIMVKFV